LNWETAAQVCRKVVRVKKPGPEKYTRTHEVTNLYRREIGGNHRLIYTIRGRKEDKVYQLLDLLAHKEYDRLFGYSTT